MNSFRIYHIDAGQFAAMYAGMHRQSALAWMSRARDVLSGEAKRICVNAARTEHRQYVRWLRSLNVPAHVAEVDIDEPTDCVIHGEQDGPECARC